MKRFSVAIGILLGLLFSIAPGPVRTGETGKSVGLSVLEAAAACPDCSGTAVEVKNTTFYDDEECTCVGSQSMTIGPGVIVQSGATVTFKAPTVKIITGNTFQPGAVINVLQVQVGSITLTATPNSVAAGATNYSTIKVEVKDTSGQPVPKGTAVTLTTTLGAFSNGSATSTITMPDNTGVTTTFLFVGTTQGTATVTATSGGVTAEPETVTVTGPTTDPATITVAAVPNQLNADGTSTSTITATVLDGTGNPVEDGTIITFTRVHGTLSSGTSTTSNGQAIVTYTAPSVKPTEGSDAVTATAPNGVTGSTSITISGPTLATIVLNATPNILPADGTSTSTITATVTVQGGASAPSGVLVIFSINSGEGALSSTEASTNSNGIASVVLTAPTSAGSAQIGARSGSISAQPITVTYQPGTMTLTIVPNSVLATGEEESVITAELKDANGYPVSSQQVQLVVSDPTMGTLDNYQPTTDANGKATATFTAGNKGGTVTITATWNSGGSDVTGSGTITIQPPPAFIQIVEGYPSPQKINIKGTGGQVTSEIKFLVKDSQGNLVDSGYRIDFSIITGPDGGENLIPASTKTSNGEVGGLLYSGFKSGPVSIRATYHHDTSINTTTSQIVIVGGPAVGEEFGISAQYLNVSGLSIAGLHNTITTNIADQYGNAIADNTAIAFKTYNTGGFFETGTSITLKGVASDDLVSPGTYLPPLNGFVSLTAEVVGGNTTRISSIAVTPGIDSNIIYAGTNGGGVYKSMDSGATWQNISRSLEDPKQGQNWIDPYVKGNSAICVDPDDHNTVYVGTGYLGRGNVYRSLDGGMNWNSNNIEEWNGLFSTNAAVLTVICESGTDYVWIGTEGKGALFAKDGKTFQWGGKIDSGPTPDPGNVGDGTITDFQFSDKTRSEKWTTTYVVPDNAQASEPQPAASNIGNGDMSSVQTDKENTITESWTVRYINAATETWSVSGTVSGIQTNQATTGAAYSSDNNEVTFTIYAGATAFAVGDKFTFDTTAAYQPYWTVSGSLSGTQGNKAYTDTPYSSDNSEIIFTIDSGPTTPFDENDEFTFEVLESGLGVGKTVTEIVQSDVTGTLYAATPSGVYKSVDKGLVWERVTRFTNDIINTLALHPDLSGGGDHIVYVGTENGGVWFGDDSGTTWEQIWEKNSLNKNMGKGLSATVPVPSVNNEGSGTMSNVKVYSNTESEFWTVSYDAALGKFEVEGSVSDSQSPATVDETYTITGVLSFTIFSGNVDFEDGDTFTFTTTRDPGKTIKDLLVDKANNRLYALTYFFGPLEPYHAVGNIYSIELDPTNNYKPKGDWEEANDNLPEFAPPGDKTLFAQYCIVADNPSAPAWFFTGGEGINMYKATEGISGIDAGNPNWKISKSGLSNLIMSRRPVLFSNRCTMTVIESTPDPFSPNDKLFRVYIQDENGNPPIKGSIFQIVTYDYVGIILPYVEDLVYPDTLAYQGTFSDPGNAGTNKPFEYRITVYPGVNVINRVDKVEFIFTPACEGESPGCSGSSVVKTFAY